MLQPAYLLSTRPSLRNLSEDVDVDELVELSLSLRTSFRGASPSCPLATVIGLAVGERGGEDREGVRVRKVGLVPIFEVDIVKI